MAHGAQRIARLWPGRTAAVAVLTLTLGTLAAVALRAESFGGLSAADWAAVRFTLTQALLSAALSVALAVPVARALARRRFAGRGLLVTLLGAPFILPVIVAILGLLAVFGRSGLISQALALVGLGPLQVYGLHGVVLAHVFFNLPLATRLVLQGWLAIPAERFRLAATLGFRSANTFRVLELPMLRSVLPGTFLVVFLLCTTSFAVALALGGGPGATTVELAIYQSFRFEFDLGKAALLALLQVAICAAAAGLALRISVPAAMGGGLDRSLLRWDAHGRGLRLLDAAVVGCAALFLLLPLGLVVARGVAGLLHLQSGLAASAARSLAVALAATAITLALALPLATYVQRAGKRGAALAETVGYLTIATSPLVIGTGLFLILYPFANPVALALPVTATVNATVSLPFALRALIPAVAQVEAAHGRLADSLGLVGWPRMRWLVLPRLRRPLGFAAGLTAALSIGDLGVVALFADPSRPTLPLAMYQLMAGYRMEAAAGAGLILLVMSLGLFWVFDRGGRVDADA